MMKKQVGLIAVLAVIVCFSGVVRVEAAGSPWKWLQSLKKDKDGPPVVLPTSVFVDESKERYYVTDAGSGSLHAYDKKGKYINSLKPGDKLDQPFSAGRDADGVLWVTEKGKNSLTRIDLKAKKIDTNVLHLDGEEVFPGRMAIYKNSFYVLDKFSGDIIAYDHDLKNPRIIDCSDCTGGFIDFVVRDGFVWGLVRRENTVYKYSIEGKSLAKIKLEGNLAFPYSLEIGPSGLLYILDRHAGSVVVFDQSGRLKYRFLKKGQERDDLYYPEDLLFDPWGRLCIVDAGNGRVDVFSR